MPSKTSSKMTLWFIILVCTLPVVLSTLIWWQGWQPSVKTQAGKLVQPVIPVSMCVRDMSGQSIWPVALQHKWVLLFEQSDSSSDPRDYVTHQLRTMQGKERQRLMRMKLFSGENASRMKEGDDSVSVQGTLCSKEFSDHSIMAIPEKDRVYVVDPEGNIMMVFDVRANPKAIYKDLVRLLSISQIG